MIVAHLKVLQWKTVTLNMTQEITAAQLSKLRQTRLLSAAKTPPYQTQ